MNTNLQSLAKDYDRIAVAIQYLEIHNEEQPELDDVPPCHPEQWDIGRVPSRACAQETTTGVGSGKSRPIGGVAGYLAITAHRL